MTTNPSLITDIDSFKSWSENQTWDLSILLAVRCATRVYPILFLMEIESSPNLDATPLRNQALLGFRANFVSYYNLNFPGSSPHAHDIGAVAERAILQGTNTRAWGPMYGENIQAFGAALTSIAYAADMTGPFLKANSVSVMEAAEKCFAARKGALARQMWNSIAIDAIFAERRGYKALLGSPLWLEMGEGEEIVGVKSPGWTLKIIKKASSHQTFRSKSWQWFLNWYLNVAEGKNRALFGFEPDSLIVNQPDQFWDGEANDVAAKISLFGLQNGILGNQWGSLGNKFELLHSQSGNDIETAENPSTTKALNLVLEKLEDFDLAAQSIEQTYNWDGFEKAWKRFRTVYNEFGGKGALDIETIYDATVTLGSYLQMNHDLKRNVSGNLTALSANQSRMFDNLMRSAAVWVRKFPTARDMDEEAGRFLQTVTAASAELLIDTAKDGPIISGVDAELMKALLDALNRPGAPAKKAGVRGYFSVRNLTIATAVFVTSAAATSTLEKIELFDKSTDWLSSNAEQVLDVIQDLPLDIRGVVNSIILDIDNGTLPRPEQSKPEILAVNRNLSSEEELD